MKPATLKALRASIAHWRRLATGKRRKDEDISSKYCALCQLFFENGCHGCPVSNATKKPLCSFTPYDSASGARDDFGLDSKPFKAVARKELEFLESLLP